MVQAGEAFRSGREDVGFRRFVYHVRQATLATLRRCNGFACREWGRRAHVPVDDFRMASST
jgi:hypothetical protein